MEIGTPLGLGLASGINAYLPLLALAVSERWLHLHRVNANLPFVTSNWFMIALTILTIVDFVADKIPVVDHAWDAAHTVIRPIAGALAAAASTNTLQGTITISAISSHILESIAPVPSSLHIVGAGFLIIVILAAILAFMSHTAKATTRLVSTFTSAGAFNVVLSIVEDLFVFIAILLSLFAPIIMLIAIAVFLVIFGRSTWQRRQRAI